MKKTLFLQELSAVLISMVVAALLAFYLSEAIGTFLNIPIKNARISADTIVLKNEKIEHSTRELSVVERQSLEISVKSGVHRFESGGVSYDIAAVDFGGGLTVLSLYPHIPADRVYGIFFLIFVIAFLVCNTLVMRYVGRCREESIILPLETLARQTKKLVQGDFEAYIPDSGAEEIRRLSGEIELLRLRLSDEVYMNKKNADDRRFLISSISHDLRTPLTALRGYIEGILDGAAKDVEKQREYLERGLEKTELINQMISDLLTYSKLDFNQVEFRFQMLNINEYLSELLRENQLLFRRENKEISLDIQTKSEYNVNVDVKQLDRVMANVLENALRYIKPDIGRVVIMLRETTGSIVLEIQDNGIGISEEDVPKIFDRFYRTEKSRKIKGSSGLGLAISKRIIENMGGRIWATGRLDEGTSIMISLKKYERGQ